MKNGSTKHTYHFRKIMVEKEVNMTVERDFDGKQQLAYCV